MQANQRHHPRADMLEGIPVIYYVRDGPGGFSVIGTMRTIPVNSGSDHDHERNMTPLANLIERLGGPIAQYQRPPNQSRTVEGAKSSENPGPKHSTSRVDIRQEDSYDSAGSIWRRV